MRLEMVMIIASVLKIILHEEILAERDAFESSGSGNHAHENDSSGVIAKG
jgi:hypothetical protein